MTPLDWMDLQQPGGASPEQAAPRGPQPAAGWTTSARPARVPSAAALAELDDLNEPQRQAVLHESGPLLILAGAGSGKTRVITRRIAWLVRERGYAPHEILAITFTNKAAKEMLERVERLIPARGMWIGTFHAMCARVLRREIALLGGYTSDFSIYDTSERNALLKRVIKAQGFDTTRFAPSLVGSWISDWKNSGAAAEPEASGAPVRGIEAQVFEEVRAAYGAALCASNALDFDDLLVLTLRLFDQHAGVRDVYAERFRQVMVDEYQDTNRVQYCLTRHFASRHGNLAVCGDPDQSIYSWRGADIRNILDFERDFGSRTTVVKLEQNYRSSDVILAAAQGLIRHNRGRKEKELWTEKRGGALIQALECADERDEAESIARRLQELQAEGRGFEQMAVFYRVNFMQRALEGALRMNGVPYQVVAGFEFYERREIRDLLAYAQLALNPQDDQACARVINVPARGVGDKSLELLQNWALDRRLALSAAVASVEARALIRGKAKSGLENFAKLLEQLTQLRELPPHAALELAIELTGYHAHLAASTEGDLESRVENLEELLSHAERYHSEVPEGGLRGFLQEVALVSDTDEYDESAARVTLMTLHAAKGLEFPVVFIAGLEEELLPHARALKEAASGEQAGLEEERRLLYVGMTRAQELLHFTHARARFQYGSFTARLPSRFLQEIPAEWIEGARPPERASSDFCSEPAFDSGADEDPFGEPSFQASRPAGRALPSAALVLKRGDLVEHDHFGRGTIEDLSGQGEGARVRINFRTHGSKLLLLAYARLKRVGGA